MLGRLFGWGSKKQPDPRRPVFLKIRNLVLAESEILSVLPVLNDAGTDLDYVEVTLRHSHPDSVGHGNRLILGKDAPEAYALLNMFVSSENLQVIDLAANYDTSVLISGVRKGVEQKRG